MLVIGTKGHAKEIVDLIDNFKSNEYVFFDNLSVTNEILFLDKKIIKDFENVKKYFLKNNNFILALGGPKNRSFLFKKFTNDLNGIPHSVIAKSAFISKNATLGLGINIMNFSFISHSVKIGNGCLINAFAKIHHDSNIGNFTEICPNATILGNCNIGYETFIGANATILPKLNIGNNVVIAAGSVVTKDIPDNCMVAGVPAVFKKNI